MDREMRCAECNCENGGDECNWIMSSDEQWEHRADIEAENSRMELIGRADTLLEIARLGQEFPNG